MIIFSNIPSGFKHGKENHFFSGGSKTVTISLPLSAMAVKIVLEDHQILVLETKGESFEWNPIQPYQHD